MKPGCWLGDFLAVPADLRPQVAHLWGLKRPQPAPLAPSLPVTMDIHIAEASVVAVPPAPAADLIFWQPTEIRYAEPTLEAPPPTAHANFELLSCTRAPLPKAPRWLHWPKWEPKVRTLLAQNIPGRRLNEAELVACVAQFRRFAPLPRQVWQRWPEAMKIYIDNTDHLKSLVPDFKCLAEEIKKRVGVGAQIIEPQPRDPPHLSPVDLYLGDLGRWRRTSYGPIPRARWSITPHPVSGPGNWGVALEGPRFSEQLDQLKALTSVVVRLSFGLLRALRVLVSPDAALEPALLRHKELNVSYDGAMWRPTEAVKWHAKFKAFPKKLKEDAIARIRQHHDGPEPTEVWWEELTLLRQLTPELVSGCDPYLEQYAEVTSRFLSHGPRPRSTANWLHKSSARLENYQQNLPTAYRQMVNQVRWQAGQQEVWGLRPEDMPPTQRPTRNFRLDQEGPFWVLRPKEAPVLGSPIVELPAAATVQFVGADGKAQEFDVDAARVKWPALKGAPVQVVTDRAQVTLEAISKPDWAGGIGRDKYGLVASVTVKGVDFRMRWVPPGQFRMGSPKNEAGRDNDEGPQHWVLHPQGFWLGETPVTQQLWEGVMAKNPARFKEPFHPVERVSWDDVQKFLAALQKEFNLLFDLPSEAEWEYACRAGTTTATYAGDLEILGANNAPLLDKIGWYGGNCGVEFELPGGYTSGWPEKQYTFPDGGTHAVGLKAANPWGLYDMLGNVWEWCRDGLRKYSEQAQAVASPLGRQGPEVARVVRGGSWNFIARSLRAAYRSAEVPGYANVYFGFRLCRGPAPRTSPADPASRPAKGPGPIQGPAAGPQDGGGPEAQARAPEGSRAAPRGRSRRPKTPGEK